MKLGEQRVEEEDEKRRRRRRRNGGEKKIYGAGRLVPCRRVFVIIVDGKKVATCTYIYIYIYLSVI